MMKRVCMLSQAQPSTNPRLVKEADTLEESGFRVEVLCTSHVAWAADADRELLAGRSWRCTILGADAHPAHTQWSRLIHRAARTIEPALHPAAVSQAALGPHVRKLAQLAAETPADLYIARHPGALSAAGRAAARHNAALAYDAEDLESGHAPLGGVKSRAAQTDCIAHRIEREWLPRCDYVTASSPAIADAYVEQYAIRRPVPILNVFPLRDRPPQFRPTTQGPLRLYWFSQTIGHDRGLQDVLRAMALIPAATIELHLRGRWAAGFEHELRRLAAELRLPQERLIHHCPAPPGEMVRLASEFDVGLALEQPVSRNRLLCLTNKMFTYMLAGNAILATSTPGQDPVLHSIGAACVSTRHGDREEMAAGLRRWHDDRAALDLARQLSWKWGENRYNWDIEKQVFLDVVMSALHSRRTAAGPAKLAGSEAGAAVGAG